MAHISTFVYCEGIQVEETNQGNKTHIINPQQIFTPAFIPSLYSFSISFGVIGVKYKENQVMVYKFINTNTNEALIDSGDININSKKTDLPEELNGFMMNIDFKNIVFKNEGYYESEIYLNNEKIGSYPIFVKGKESNE